MCSLRPYGPDVGVWPRVCWISTGLLSILPIHAAGYHDVKEPRNTIDRVISSYIPTLKSLSYARQRHHNEVPGSPVRRPKSMLVAMPKTEDRSDLPFVEKEVQDYFHRFVRQLFSKIPRGIWLFPLSAAMASSILRVMVVIEH
jgi:hypothetical protein